MTLRTIITLILLATALPGCASPINRQTATRYFQAGTTAMEQGNLPHAREMFSRALINARLGDMGADAEGQILKKLGQVTGNMCLQDDAEKAFTEAIAAYSRAYGESSKATFPIRLELAQFSYDVGRYEKAVVYFEQAFPFGIAILEKVDPVGYVAVMKDYADALSKTGKADQAKQTLQKVAEVDGKETTAKVAKGSEYVRYPSICR
jgi:tetratricopeptide (TPR) repeat protein